MFINSRMGKLGHHPTTNIYSTMKIMCYIDTDQHGRFSYAIGQRNIYGMALPVRSSKIGKTICCCLEIYTYV